MSRNSIDHIANNRKNIIFVKRNDKNTSNTDMQKISDVSAGVASIIWDSMKMRNLFNGKQIAFNMDPNISWVTKFLLSVCDLILKNHQSIRY